MTSSEITNIFDALGNETRLAILKKIIDYSPVGLSPRQIGLMLNLTPENLSYHLSLLMHIGLISQNREGLEETLQVRCSVLEQASDYLLQNCCTGSGTNCSQRWNTVEEQN